MEAYELISRQGSGSYAVVWRARRRSDGAAVAVKELKQACESWEDVVNMKEVAVMRALGSHPNVLRLHAVTRLSGRAYLILDQCDCNVYQVISSQRTLAAGKGAFSEGEVRWLMRHVLSGLHHMHSAGWMHRDMKPENVLLSSLDSTAKVCDFGQARQVLPRTGNGGKLTDYVSTRWYRAPELLLHAPWYGPAVDVWACGCMMAECYTGRPLLAGESEPDTLSKAMAILGSPASSWRDSVGLASSLHIRLPESRGVGLAAHVTRASPAALSLMQAMLTWDPAARPTAAELLKHPFFTSGPDVAISTIGAASLRGGEESMARSDARAAQATIDEALAGKEGNGEGKQDVSEPAGSRSLASDGKEERASSESESESVAVGSTMQQHVHRGGMSKRTGRAVNPFASSLAAASLPLPTASSHSKEDSNSSDAMGQSDNDPSPSLPAPLLQNPRSVAQSDAAAELKAAPPVSVSLVRSGFVPPASSSSKSDDSDDEEEEEGAYVPSIGLGGRSSGR